MVKSDIKETYRMILILTHDQHLLGVRWNYYFYIDRIFPFHLRSAPKILSAVSDELQWILTQYGITYIILYYLDDFIFVAAYMVKAMRQKHTLVSNIQCLGVPLEQSKLVGSSICLTFQGIQFDTKALILYLLQTTT